VSELGPGVAVVTDSAGSLPDDETERDGVHVVPLRVSIDGHEYAETELSGDQLVSALRAGATVSTSQPSPEAFAAAYRAAAAAGAAEIVSIHLSAALSGTCAAARIAAAGSVVPVTVVDSECVGAGLGFAVRAASAAARTGADGVGAVAAAEESLRSTEVFFYVDTLEYLRRGGRIGAAASLLGSVLAIKPILRLQEGQIVVAEKVRTAARGLARLAELAVTCCAAGSAELGVQHLGAADPALDLVAVLRERVPATPSVALGEIGAAIGAHVGPGTVAVTVRRF